MYWQAEEAAVILDRRTAALATRTTAAEAEAVRRRAVIVASVGQSLVGLEVAQVGAVTPFTGCARIPVRDSTVLGVVGRAGRFYSVIGLRQWLGESVSDPEKPNAVVKPAHLLLLRGSPHLALGVDRVLGRFDLAGDESTFNLDGRLVALLDLQALLGRLSGASPS